MSFAAISKWIERNLRRSWVPALWLSMLTGSAGAAWLWSLGWESWAAGTSAFCDVVNLLVLSTLERGKQEEGKE